MDFNKLKETVLQLGKAINNYRLNIRNKEGEHLANVPGLLLVGALIFAFPLSVIGLVVLVATEHKLSLISEA